ncbi:MMPL family transporter [Rhodococcoides yunnanense]|uniref:MMPL family transporter n=1 Tax=Rhodococcoides yunnanense TaxID=278209 RepID=UPI00352FFE48
MPQLEIVASERSAAIVPSILFFELGDYATGDLMLIVLVASALTFLIFAVMLRSVVAPAYILISVLVSYLSAIHSHCLTRAVNGWHCRSCSESCSIQSILVLQTTVRTPR